MCELTAEVIIHTCPPLTGHVYDYSPHACGFLGNNRNTASDDLGCTRLPVVLVC